MKSIWKRGLTAFALAFACAAGLQAQQEYPNRPVELVVPYGAGGSVDAMARVFAELASKRTGQPWTVINRAGAGGLVGFASLANGRSDGYTVGFSPASPLTNSPFVTSKMPFDTHQVAPVCQIFENTFAVVVRSDAPWKSMPELLGASMRGDKPLPYGHAGPASIPHLSMAAIEQATGAKFNAVAYRTDGAIWNDLFGGALAFVAQPVTAVVGKPVRVLAVLSDRRHPLLPQVPSVKELGYPALSPGLNGLFVHRSAAPAVFAALEALCADIVRGKAFADAAQAAGQSPAYLPRPAFEARIERAVAANARIVPTLRLERN